MGAPWAMACLLWFGSGAPALATVESVAPVRGPTAATPATAATAVGEATPQRPLELPVRRLASAIVRRGFEPEEGPAPKPDPQMGASVEGQANAGGLEPSAPRQGGVAPPVFRPFGELRRFGVKIVSPAADEAVAGRVNVRAEVSADRPSEVSAVDFFIDGRLIFSDAMAPYELLWDAGRSADHLIEVRAYGPGRQMVRDLVQTYVAKPGRGLGGFAARVERVELHVRVEGKGDEPPELGRGAFQVLEDGVAQPVLAIDRVADLPLAVGLLIDHSRSMLEQLDRAREAAASFVEGLMTHPNDKAFVLGFANLPIVFQEFTNDSVRLAEAISLIDPGRYTALYDSIVAAARRFTGVDGRRAVILLTDGADQGSEHDLDEAIAAAQRADVALYPVAVGLSPRFLREQWILRQLAAETGGRLFTLASRGDPEEIYQAIEEDLRSQYRITYAPLVPGGGGEWRELEVRVMTDDENLEARTRAGYFAH